MYHMGFHLEAQRQQRTIDRKKEFEKGLAQSKGSTPEERLQTRSGTRPETTSSRDQASRGVGTKPPQSAPVAGRYQRIGPPMMEERVFSRPDEYQNRWLNKRFHVRHDKNLVPLPFRKVDITH